MSTLKQLLDQYCSGGVDYVRLGDVLAYEQPGKYIVGKADYAPEYPTPVLTAGKTFILGYTNETNGIYPASEGNPVIIFDDFTTATKWVNFPFKVKSSAMKLLTPLSEQFSLRFVYFALADVEVDTTDHKRQWISTVSNVKIPLPPREVQDKIVEYLDAFAAVGDSLDAEIAQREKQLEAYKEQIFESLGGGIPRAKIGEIASIVRGRGLTKKDLTESGVPAIHYGQIYTKYELSESETLSFVDEAIVGKLTQVDPGGIILASTSENMEDVGKPFVWLGKEPAYTGLHTLVLKHDQCPMYLGHWLSSYDFYRQKISVCYGAKVIELSAKALASIEIPLPALSVQQSIADKLDTMQALIDNLKHERELRGKQFEFYRSRLLDFTAKESETND